MRVTLRPFITKRYRTVGAVACSGKTHRIIVRGGKVHFANHRLADLALLIALDSHCTCADILHALRTPDKRLALESLLPRALLTSLEPYLYPGDDSYRSTGDGRSPLSLPWPTQQQKLLDSAIGRRFTPVLQTLNDQGLFLCITPRSETTASRHAITLEAHYIPLGYFADNAWHLSAQQVAKMARATTAYGTAHPAWGQETCRVCPRAASPTAPTDGGIEELPGPRTWSESTFQHAKSASHLQAIRRLLEEAFGPESFFSPPNRYRKDNGTPDDR